MIIHSEIVLLLQNSNRYRNYRCYWIECCFLQSLCLRKNILLESKAQAVRSGSYQFNVFVWSLISGWCIWSLGNWFVSIFVCKLFWLSILLNFLYKNHDDAGLNFEICKTLGSPLHVWHLELDLLILASSIQRINWNWKFIVIAN